MWHPRVLNPQEVQQLFDRLFFEGTDPRIQGYIGRMRVGVACMALETMSYLVMVHQIMNYFNRFKDTHEKDWAHQCSCLSFYFLTWSWLAILFTTIAVHCKVLSAEERRIHRLIQHPPTTVWGG